MSSGLWLSVAGDTLVALAFAFVGWRVVARRRPGADAAAVAAFASWWLLFAAQAALAAVRVGLIAAGFLDPGVSDAIFVVENALAALALWGLGAYLGFLYRGDRRGWIAWAVATAALAAYYTWLVLSHDVVRVFAQEWKTGREWATPLPLWQQLVAVGGYNVALLGLTVAYLRLARVVTQPVLRQRVRAVALALALLAVVSFVSLGIPEDTAWGPLVGLARLAAAGMVAVAYAREPPSAARP